MSVDTATTAKPKSTRHTRRALHPLTEEAIAIALDENSATHAAHIEFAKQLRALMIEKRISASDLARGVWGTMTDPRGYEVARNRDRIGQYLAGKSYPEAENRAKIAKVLGVDAQALDKYQPTPVVRESVKPGPNDIYINFSAEDAVCVSIIKMIVSRKTATTLLDLLATDPVRQRALAKKASGL